MVFTWKVRVYYEDTDAGGIVYYANYLRFMERARTEWLRAGGVSQQFLVEQQGLQFVVARLSMTFMAAARLDDVLEVTVKPTRLRRTVVELEQQANCGDKSVCRAEVTVACVHQKSLRPAAIPASVAKLTGL